MTLESDWNPRVPSSNPAQWGPFTFNPVSLNGFSDYQSVYSQFRIKKCVIKINRGPNTNLAYLVAPSRTFANTTGPITPTGGSGVPEHMLPYQTETALRQTRYQREIMPNSMTGKVRVGFHPFTMVAAYGPVNVNFAGTLFTRVWNLNKWTPMSWANQSNPLYCFGPYICLNDALTNLDPTNTQIHMVLEVYLQFKGQK